MVCMSLQRIDTTSLASSGLPLFDAASTRQIEAISAQTLAPNTLMQRAGLATARLMCALAPHARVVWLACGPGNNGGDGLEAAMQLRMMGREALVTWLGEPEHCPADARASWERARDAGVIFLSEPPARFDAAIDALLGIGASSAAQSRPMLSLMRDCLQALAASSAPVLQVDLPSGLDADTGNYHSDFSVIQEDSVATKTIAARAHSDWSNGQFGLKIGNYSAPCVLQQSEQQLRPCQACPISVNLATNKKTS
jgi:hydroxyethylthiazole kinase-like uncharacterized protein yjeF